MANFVEINNDDIFEDDLEILEIIQFGFPRHIYVRLDHFHTLDELGFYRRFRFTKRSTLELLRLIEGDIEYPSDMNQSLSPINQLLLFLRFMASNGHLQSLADFVGVHLSTVSRTICRVGRALAGRYNDYIKFPSNQQQINSTQVEFYEIAQFPCVIGAVDCTHIKIQSPGGNDGEVFRNRKGFFSFNVQVIGDANLKILNLVARWPGSAHDSTIFNNSNIKISFDIGNFPNCFLLGDSGYPVRSYFLTPLLHPGNRPQQLYNEAQIRTRNTIERLFGVWKRRFPVLAYGLRLKMETSMMLIVAAGVLHNFAKEQGEDEAPPAEGIDEEELNGLIQLAQVGAVQHVEGNNLNGEVRNNLINDHFANL